MVNNLNGILSILANVRDLHKVFGAELLIGGQIEISARDQCEDARRELLLHQVLISRTVQSIFELSMFFVIL